MIFTGEVTWQDLLGRDYKGLIRSMRRRMFGRYIFKNFAPRGQEGVPTVFGVPAARSGNKTQLDMGVRLLNLNALRESYQDLRNGIFWNQQKSISAPGEEYLKFYADRAGEPTASKLPDALSSRRFWDNASTSAVSIVHFAGVNCDADVMPFLQSGKIAFQPYGKYLRQCSSTTHCKTMCRMYSKYVEATA